MILKLIKKEEAKITFYDGISLIQYQDLDKRWTEMLSIVHKEVHNYINDDKLCFIDGEELFPMRSKLTGNYYIESVSYCKKVTPKGFIIMINTRFTEKLPSGEDDYLLLEVTLFTTSVCDNFEFWGINSFSI